MARYAVIQNGVVQNLIEADQKFVDANYPGAVLIKAGVWSDMQASWDGKKFAPSASVTALP
jgi:hypothetical protein